MDIWLLKCMMFVAVATFEYAVLLGSRFGEQKHLSLMGYDANYKATKCNRVDKTCLLLFLGFYALAVVAYFVVVTQWNHHKMLA